MQNRIVTHNGVFHADEALAIVILRMIYGDMEITRTRDRYHLEGYLNNKDVFVLDVGADYRPNMRNFDHHQKGGAGVRDCGTPYATSGLVWKHFGNEVLRTMEIPIEHWDYIFDKVDDVIIRHVDAQDVGHGKPLPFSMNMVISLFNPTWLEEPEEEHLGLEDAYLTAYHVLNRAIRSYWAEAEARLVIREAPIKNQVMVLDKYIPWSGFPVPIEVLYVVFENDQGTHMVQQVPSEPGGFEGRKPLPESWAGLRGDELASLTGVSDAVFCHNGRFICGAESREGALELARLAVEE